MEHLTLGLNSNYWPNKAVTVSKPSQLYKHEYYKYYNLLIIKIKCSGLILLHLADNK